MELIKIDYDLFKKILKEIPSNIFFKDTECRYVFSTHYWRHLQGAEDPSWDIAGKTDLEIRKDKENAKLAMEQDREIIRRMDQVALSPLSRRVDDEALRPHRIQLSRRRHGLRELPKQRQLL